jgi:tetratricopeptide (TPR) repeat protein
MKDLYLFKLYADAVAFYKENKNLVDPDTWPEVRHYLGLAYAGLEMHEETIKLLEANKDLTDQEAERLIGLGRSYLQLGRLNEAAQVFDQFRERFPKSKQIAQTFLDQALAEFDQGLDDPALSHLEKAVAADPALERDVKIQNLLGQLFMRKGQYEQGITATNKAVNYMKNMPDQEEALFMAYSRLGQAYAHLGREAEAVEALDAALAAAPASPMPETLYLMANAFKMLKLINRQEQILNMLARSTKPFWREVADEEMKALKPNDQITRLLKSAPPDTP